MPIPITSHPAQRAGCALYEINPRSGATIEMFYADGAFARSFGARGEGFYWRKRSCSPDLPSGPFIVCLDAYRDALARSHEAGSSFCIANADTVRTQHLSELSQSS